MVSIAFICFAVPLALMLPILQGRSRWLVTYLLAGSYIAVCAGAVNGMIRQALGITSLELSLSVAPIVEEILKALPVLIYAAARSDRRSEVLALAFSCGVGFATLLAVSAACVVALACFYLLCGRLKTGTAFTEHNARAMGAIARCFGLSALVLIVALPVLRLLIGETLLPMIYVAVVAFLFGFAALLSHALSLLVWRAQALQAENDLTI